MSNPLYWEDQVSSTNGGRADMIVDQHAPSFSVQWGKGKYDDVGSIPFAEALGRLHDWLEESCTTCGLPATGPNGLCAYCTRTQHADELRRMQQDAPMGSCKRSPITIHHTDNATHILAHTPEAESTVKSMLEPASTPTDDSTTTLR